MRAADAVQHAEPGSAGRRFGGLAATAVMWGVYLSLWAPVVHRLTDPGGLPAAGQGPGTGRALLWVAVATLVLSSALIGWAEYNRIRFTGVERRHRPPDVEPVEVGHAVGADAEATDALQRAAVSWVSCREDGSPETVEVGSRRRTGRHAWPAAPAAAVAPASVRTDSTARVPAQRAGSDDVPAPVTTADATGGHLPGR